MLIISSCEAAGAVCAPLSLASLVVVLLLCFSVVLNVSKVVPEAGIPGPPPSFCFRTPVVFYCVVVNDC